MFFYNITILLLITIEIIIKKKFIFISLLNSIDCFKYVSQNINHNLFLIKIYLLFINK